MGALIKPTISLIYCLLLFCALEASPLWARQSASIVICAETGKVHHAANPDVVTYPASLTKMMTLYLTFQALREKKLTFDKKLFVSQYASQQEPCSLGLKPGTYITVRQAILGLVTKSANDAAVVLAEALGKGSEGQFAKKMTQQARKLGMMRTVFKNASGLPNKQQVTTARDMAILSRSLYLHFPEYFRFFKEKEFVYKGVVHKNHNHLLGKVHGVDGIKTGFINAAGFNLAASMVRDNRRIIAVVLGGDSIRDRDKKMKRLLETTHARVKHLLPPQRKTRHASIEDLIHSLGNSEGRTRDMGTTQKALYLAGKGKIKSLEADYESLDDLFEAIQPPSPKEKKRKRYKSSL